MSKQEKGVQPAAGALNYGSQPHPYVVGNQSYPGCERNTTALSSAVKNVDVGTDNPHHPTCLEPSRTWAQWQGHPTYQPPAPSWDQFAPYSSYPYATAAHTSGYNVQPYHQGTQPVVHGYDNTCYAPVQQGYNQRVLPKPVTGTPFAKSGPAQFPPPYANTAAPVSSVGPTAGLSTGDEIHARQEAVLVTETKSKKRQKVSENGETHRRKKPRVDGQQSQKDRETGQNTRPLHRINSVDIPRFPQGSQDNPVILDISSPPQAVATRAKAVPEWDPPRSSQQWKEQTPMKMREPHLNHVYSGEWDSSLQMYPTPPPSTAKSSKKRHTAANVVHAPNQISVPRQGAIPPQPLPPQAPPTSVAKTMDQPPNMATSADEPPLCKEQADLVDLIMSGRNVFYTGSAGCGKSTVLKAFVKRFKARGKMVNILAPTGRAALAINGTTTWNYMGWVPGHHKKTLDELLKGVHGKHVYKRLNETKVLVIDEISMVENLHFERINKVMQEARKNGKAFGGVQLIVTGDFCQLPPVKPFQHCIHCGKELRKKGSDEYHCSEHGVYYDKDKWAFRSAAWKECDFVHVNLTNIHRQSDKVFIDLLQKLRIGWPFSTAEVNRLLNHPTKGVNANAVKLFGSRAEVDRLNYERFSKLNSRARTYKCVDEFVWNEQHRNLERMGRINQDGALMDLEEREHRYSSKVHLKKGMAVVLLANLDISLGLVNGAQGTIQDFVPYEETDMPRAPGPEDSKKVALGFRPPVTLTGQYAEYREAQIQKFINQAECKEWPKVRFNNGQLRVIYADCTVNEYGDFKPYTLLTRTQIPLIAGYAITTHKSQGMTLDKVEVDLSRTFEAGQAYVALSRARSLDGLKVVSFPPSAQRGADPQVQEFLREKFPESFSGFEEVV